MHVPMWNSFWLAAFFFTSLAQASTSVPAVLEGTDSLSGKLAQIELKAAKKGTVVLFLSARCPCSRSHEESLKALWKEYAPRGFQFIGVHSNRDEDAEVTRRHFTGTALPFPIIEDPELKLANAFGALKTPHSYLLKPDGEMAFQGGVDNSADASQASQYFLKEALSAVDSGRDPAVKVARALGCAIKR